MDYTFATQWRSTLWLMSIMMMSMFIIKTESSLLKLLLCVVINFAADRMYSTRKKAEQKFDEKIIYCYNESEATDKKNAPT